MEVFNWVDRVIQLFQMASEAGVLLSYLSLSSGKSIVDLASITKQSVATGNLKFSISITLHLPQDDSATIIWHDFLSNHLVYLAHKVRGKDLLSTFEYFNQSFSFFTKVFKEIPEGRWSAPLVQWFCCELYGLAKAADKETESTGRKPCSLNEAVRSIQQLFAVCQASSQAFPECKIYSAIYCANVLFKIFFGLDTIQSCITLIKWYSQYQTKVRLEEYPMSTQVTFKYFAGRLALHQMEIAKAREDLEFVLLHCHKRALKNRRLVLRYLIPAKLLMGSYPSEELLRRYKLKEYIRLAQAVRAGNLKVFNEELERYEELYITKGVYLVIDKLRLITQRNLFKKVVRILCPSTFQLTIESLNQALQWASGVPVESLETECTIANLIHQGYMKAYVSHEKKNIVMSKKQEIFPPLRKIYEPSSKPS